VLLVILGAAAAQKLGIVITPDRFPADTKWSLVVTATNQIVGNGGPGNFAGTLPTGTKFTFLITDAKGDGICCANGQGSVALRNNDVNFYTNNGQFGASASVIFSFNTAGQALDANGKVFGAPVAPAPVAGAGGYNIELVPAAGFVANTAVLQQAVKSLTAAARKWETFITGDLPAVNGIDDLRITYNFSPIDGAGKIIGSAGPNQLRAGTLLPFTGSMNFDTADIGTLTPNQQTALFLHEMGHVLGIGTIWSQKGCSLCETGNGNYNPKGVCPEAQSRFNASPGRNPAANLLIEQNGGPGTACGHWSETQLQSEVMTGFLTVNTKTGISEVSTITLGGLRDLGYTVDFTKADAFSIPTSNLNSEIIISMGDDTTKGDMTVHDTDAEKEWTGLMPLQPAQTAGIVVGCVAAVGLTVAGVVVYKRRRNGKFQKFQDGDHHIALTETGTAV